MQQTSPTNNETRDKENVLAKTPIQDDLPTWAYVAIVCGTVLCIVIVIGLIFRKRDGSETHERSIENERRASSRRYNDRPIGYGPHQPTGSDSTLVAFDRGQSITDRDSFEQALHFQRFVKNRDKSVVEENYEHEFGDDHFGTPVPLQNASTKKGNAFNEFRRTNTRKSWLNPISEMGDKSTTDDDNSGIENSPKRWSFIKRRNKSIIEDDCENRANRKQNSRFSLPGTMNKKKREDRTDDVRILPDVPPNGDNLIVNNRKSKHIPIKKYNTNIVDEHSDENAFCFEDLTDNDPVSSCKVSPDEQSYADMSQSGNMTIPQMVSAIKVARDLKHKLNRQRGMDNNKEEGATSPQNADLTLPQMVGAIKAADTIRKKAVERNASMSSKKERDAIYGGDSYKTSYLTISQVVAAVVRLLENKATNSDETTVYNESRNTDGYNVEEIANAYKVLQKIQGNQLGQDYEDAKMTDAFISTRKISSSDYKSNESDSMIPEVVEAIKQTGYFKDSPKPNDSQQKGGYNVSQMAAVAKAICAWKKSTAERNASQDSTNTLTDKTTTGTNPSPPSEEDVAGMRPTLMRSQFADSNVKIIDGQVTESYLYQANRTGLHTDFGRLQRYAVADALQPALPSRISTCHIPHAIGTSNLELIPPFEPTSHSKTFCTDLLPQKSVAFCRECDQYSDSRFRIPSSKSEVHIHLHGNDDREVDIECPPQGGSHVSIHPRQNPDNVVDLYSPKSYSQFHASNGNLRRLLPNSNVKIHESASCQLSEVDLHLYRDPECIFEPDLYSSGVQIHTHDWPCSTMYCDSTELPVAHCMSGQNDISHDVGTVRDIHIDRSTTTGPRGRVMVERITEHFA